MKQAYRRRQEHRYQRKSRAGMDRELNPGERRVEPPQNCDGCGGMITVTPCRLCTLRASLPEAAGGQHAA